VSTAAPAQLRWLDAAARLALPFLGTTAENPTVGAIVVSPEGRLLGRGVTAPGGRPHAEPQALAMAGQGAAGATLYVTLEPCNHWGRTPPCVDAVIAAKVATVICGCVDPDSRTAGKGVAKLRAAGIDVIVAPDHMLSRKLHQGFFKRILTGRPLVTAKLAVSKDGMIGLPDKGNVPITGETAKRWTHMQRALSDAVMIGAGTARLDDPRLSVRLSGLENRRPLRVILAGKDELNPALNLFANSSVQHTVVIAKKGHLESVSENVELIEVDSVDSAPDLVAGLRRLGERGISRLFVEGGARLTGSLLNAGLVDRFELLEGDKIVGPEGVPASVRFPLSERLSELGFRAVDRRALGCDRLTSFEKSD